MTTTAPGPARPDRSARRGFVASLGRRERSVLVAMAAFVALLHVLGWGVLAVVVAPQGLTTADGHVFGLALGVTAYLLGMRHAFDADHIAAIDNTTRKLVADGGRPLSVGFWFSLGHSSVVFALCALLALGVRSLAGQVQDEGSTLQEVAGLTGTAVSGTFLVLLGLVNLVSLVAIVKVWRAARRGSFDEAGLEEHLERRGLLNRLLRPIISAVRTPRRMYPVGVLFGLGFDTATEISLLVLAGTSAAVALPWYAILVLPVLFAAGMSLLDSADGVLMNYAYGWAATRPVRKIYYSAVITALSVVVALTIGGIGLTSILVDRAGITSGPLHAVGTLDLAGVGYVVVALFVATWVAALVWWRVGRVEQRWEEGLRAGGPAPTNP